MTSLEAVQSGWDHAARADAMGNILTSGSWTPAEFFAHGQGEIDDAFARFDALEISRGTGRALDFGCGVGRLTQALRTYYKRVDGVDVSEEMIAQAKALDPDGRCRFHHNPEPNLKLFRSGSFDFVYSMLVLQHMPQELQEGYVREFFRVLKPGGVAMFEIPDGPDYAHPNAWLSMYAVPRVTVEQWVEDAGGLMVDAELIPEPSVWNCYRYSVTR